MQAEKKTAEATELRESRPETIGIALLRTAKAPAKAEAAAVHEMPEYEEDQESNRWYEKNPWRSGQASSGVAPRRA